MLGPDGKEMPKVPKEIHNKDLFCPLINMQCKGETCSWYTKLSFINVNQKTQEKEEVNEWKCAINWMPPLMNDTAAVGSRIYGMIGSMLQSVASKQSSAVLPAHMVPPYRKM